MELVLVAPGLLALAPAALAGDATLSRIAAVAEPIVVDDLDQALLGALDMVVAAAPLAALGAGIDPAGRFVIRADPVTMRVTHDDVRIVARVDDLDAREVATLVTMLDAHFAAEGLSFLAPRGDAWFAACHAAQEIAATPLDAAIGRTLRPCLPTGTDAGRWRRWLTEAQMLLHEHALGSRAHPVNGLWFSGGGMLKGPAGSHGVPGGDGGLPRICAGPGRDSDVARGIARLAGSSTLSGTSVAAAIAAAGDASRLVIVLARAIEGDASACSRAHRGGVARARPRTARASRRWSPTAAAWARRGRWAARAAWPAGCSRRERRIRAAATRPRTMTIGDRPARRAAGSSRRWPQAASIPCWRGSSRRAACAPPPSSTTDSPHCRRGSRCAASTPPRSACTGRSSRANGS